MASKAPTGTHQLRISLWPQGDSGGPATYKQGDQHVLAGVISLGLGYRGALCGKVSALARVAYFREDIDQVLQNAEFCPNGREAEDL